MSGNVLYIGNGIDLEKFNRSKLLPRRDEIKASLDLADGPIITIIARLTFEKGYKELLEALAACKHMSWTILAIGEDDGDGRRIYELVRKHNLEDRIKFLGSRNDIPELLSLTDIYVLPSHREGMPRSVIEAQAMGVPAIVTDIRGSREVVLDGQTGLIVPPEDPSELASAIASLLVDPEMRRRLGSAAELHARANYDEKFVFSRISEAFQNMEKNR